MEEPTGKPEVQNWNYFVLPYHVLIKFLFQQAP